MASRSSNLDISSIADISSLKPPMQWHSLKCELVTPMYGGGITSTVVDTQMPIRVTGIRGQLRFWWRLLAKQKWYKDLTDTQISKKEFTLWGGMNSSDDDGKASLVMLRVRDVQKINIEPWAEYKLNKNNREVLEPKNWANVPYALFPAQGRTEKNPDEEPHSLLREGCSWTLEFTFAIQISEQQKNEVWESIRWWASFGGVGSRTRRGLGAVKVDSHEKISIVTTNELEQTSLKFRIVPANNSYKAWESSVSKLQKFRQIGAGRNDYSSRSHWSEPDAIRQITGQALVVTDLKSHAKRKTKGNIFPRAGFGLPIIFKFKDGGDNRNNDPKTTTLTAKYNHEGSSIDFERLASPLILRPYLDKNKKWNALALCLPDKLVNDSDFSLKLDESDVKYWDKSQANDIKPLNINGEILKPLDAFLAYFSNN